MKKSEVHLFVSDFQIPEEDSLAIEAVLKFIPDLKPDYIHFLGDILDLTKMSSFDANPYDKHSLMDEITAGRKILKRFVDVGKKANKDCKFNFFSGNHEERQLRALSKSPQFADLEVDGELILSLPHLLQLKKLGIKWIPYYQEYFEHGVFIEHGDIARSHGSYTAKAMLEKRGNSGFSGHTHRLGIHMKTYSGITKFWVENGCLCKLNFKFPYHKSNDWQNGFSVGIYEDRKMYPVVIPIFNHSFYWGGKKYGA